VIKNLIRCTVCNQVIPNYRRYELSQAERLPGVEWSKADPAGAKEFLRTHFNHRLEELFVETDSCVSEDPIYEPLRVTYFIARTPHRKFLIRRTKMALDQPASYMIIPGRLDICNVSLKIEEYNLRKQIAAEKGFPLLLKRKMEKFIKAFRDETAAISPEDFGGEAEAIEEGETSLIAYGGLKDARWEKILNRCSRFLEESELKLIARFIDENRDPPGVLSIGIQRRISIAAGIQKREESGMADLPT
jgi:hypothetical protein